MAQLIVTIEGEETTVALERGEIASVGRDPGNTIALTDERKASRRHCQFTPVEKDGVPAWELSDLGATNKTRVNGTPTDRKLLTSGDVVQVGSVKMRFEDLDEEMRLREAGRQGVCYLEWMSGGRKGEKVMLSQSRVTLGRRDSNTIPLDDRMSSGHHAEVTKDLNGYTIRDLGSTNGTLVNGEPTTEMQLAHGMRIRVGNSRFVFKDPSMKDVEVELAQFEEDEGWGMMGDIDLTKARGSYAGLLIGLVILAGAAAGGWYIAKESEKRSGQVETAIANEIENGDMEDENLVLWSPETENESIAVRIDQQGKTGRGLSVANRGEPGTPTVRVLYTEELEALADKPFRVAGWFRPRGEGNASLVAVWRRRPRTLTQTVPLAAGTGGWVRVDRVLVRPKWATALQIGVLVDPGASANVDELQVVRIDSGGPTLTSLKVPGTPTAYSDSTGSVDIIGRSGPIVVGARPVAKKDGRWLCAFVPDDGQTLGAAGGTITGHFMDLDEPVAAKITWTITDQGIRGAVSCEGAEAVGVETDLLRSNIGDQLSVLNAVGEERKLRTITSTPGTTSESVIKSLAGSMEPGRGSGEVVLYILNDGQGDGALELSDAADAMLMTVRQSSPGASGAVEIVTDLSQQKQLAQEQLDRAERLLRDSPGPGIEILRALASAFPFEKAIKERALSKARAREDEALRDLEGLRKAFAEFKIYRSEASLRDAQARLASLSSQFPPRTDGSGGIEQDVAEIGTAFALERRDFYEEFASPELARLERLADMLRTVPGYEPMAALYLKAITEKFQDLASEDTAFGRRVLNARKQFDELLEDPKVKAAFPPTAQ